MMAVLFCCHERASYCLLFASLSQAPRCGWLSAWGELSPRTRHGDGRCLFAEVVKN